jgi:GntR family transcriptional regulator/MocR family aminotransferase
MAASGALVDAKHAADGYTALLSQGVLASFIAEGHLADHLRTTRTIYNERRLGFLVDPLSKFGAGARGELVFGYAGAARVETQKCLKVVLRSIAT